MYVCALGQVGLLNIIFWFPQIALPTKPHWYLLFGATEEEIKDICLTTLKLYTRKKVSKTLSSSCAAIFLFRDCP